MYQVTESGKNAESEWLHTEGRDATHTGLLGKTQDPLRRKNKWLREPCEMPEKWW